MRIRRIEPEEVIGSVVIVVLYSIVVVGITVPSTQYIVGGIGAIGFFAALLCGCFGGR